MSKKIRPLPDLLKNQVAAFQVVQRPSDALKELAENSCDAKGVQAIKIHLYNGGRDGIQVIDDGEGIAKEDLALAITRHATSKIYSLDDLYQVRTLGFRGEGLASIAAISRFTLTSREHDSNCAWQIVSEHGIASELTPAALLQGTVAEVKDFYFNIPARRKFLKSAKTEFSYCEDIVKRLALANPALHITLLHNQRQQLQFTGTDLFTRITAILGNRFAESALKVQIQINTMQLHGYIGPPSLTHESRDSQYFFVNGRFIRDKVIMHAIKEAYRDMVGHNEHPLYILFLEMDPSQIDVNIHPSKIEVRFYEPQAIHLLIYQAVNKALSKNYGAPLTQTPSSSLTSAVGNAHSGLSQKIHPPFLGSKSSNSLFYQKPPLFSRSPQLAEPLAHYEKLFAPLRQKEETPIAPLYEALPRLGMAIAQLRDQYILAENSEGLVVVNIAAAYKHITYERLNAALEKQHIAIHELLIPYKINDQGEQPLSEDQIVFLNRLGFKITIEFPSQIIIHTVPLFLKNTDLSQLIPQILKDALGIGSLDELVEKKYTLFATIIRYALPNHQLTVSQMNALLREIESIESLSPDHPSPAIWFNFSLAKLETFFVQGD